MTDKKVFVIQSRKYGKSHAMKMFHLQNGSSIRFDENESEKLLGGKPVKMLSPSAAARLQIMTDLIFPPILNEIGEVIGYGQPIIPKEEALKLLELPTMPRTEEDA